MKIFSPVLFSTIILCLLTSCANSHNPDAGIDFMSSPNPGTAYDQASEPQADQYAHGQTDPSVVAAKMISY